MGDVKQIHDEAALNTLKQPGLWTSVVSALEAVFPGAKRDFGLRPDKVDDDAQILAAMLEAGDERSFLRLWDNDRRLVIPAHFARLPGADEAITAMARKGWPVSVRKSGGTAVAHGLGVLNISLFVISRAPISLHNGYEQLANVIVEAAHLKGVRLTVGRHARAYCAGSHDIGWRGRKIAGTAGLIRCKGDLTGSLFHACLSVFDDGPEALNAITSFEQGLGRRVDYRKEDHVSLAEVLEAESDYAGCGTEYLLDH